MKRIHIALILLTIITLLCSTQIVFIYTSCNRFIEKIEYVEKKFSNGEYMKAKEISEEIEREWKQTSKIADMFLFHDYVDDITSNINQMKIYIEENEAADFYIICSILKNQIASLKNSEIPTAENII